MDEYTVRYVFDDAVTDAHIDDAFRYLDTRCSVLSTLREYDSYEERLFDGKHLRLRYEGTVFDVRVGDPELHEGLTVVTIAIPERWILPTEDDSDQAAVDRMNDFYTFLGDLYQQFVEMGLPPVFVYGLNFAEYEIAHDPTHVNQVDSERLLNAEVPGIYWFQIFPPAVVAALGEDRVLTSPAYRLDQLTDGAVLLAATKGVIVSEPEDRSVEAAEHLGIPYEQ